MKRKLFSTILFGALLTASTSGLTSCKDYDEDNYNDLRNQLQNQNATINQLINSQITFLTGEIGRLEGIIGNINSCTCNPADVDNKISQALANYAAFEKRGFVLKGIFDVNPRLVGVSIRGVPIRMMDELKTFVQQNDVEIAVLTIPKDKAIEVANMLVDNGVRAIWNFAHTDLNLPDHIIVENVHLSESLMQLSYNISRYNEEHKK